MVEISLDYLGFRLLHLPPYLAIPDPRALSASFRHVVFTMQILIKVGLN